MEDEEKGWGGSTGGLKGQEEEQEQIIKSQDVCLHAPNNTRWPPYALQGQTFIIPHPPPTLQNHFEN